MEQETTERLTAAQLPAGTQEGPGGAGEGRPGAADAGTQALRRRLAPFAELVQTLWDTCFCHLDARLSPSDYASPDRLPAGLARAVGDVLFTGKLFACSPGACWEIDTAFGMSLAAVQLPGGDGFVVIGPYVPARGPARPLEEALAAAGVPPARAEEYRAYCNAAPVLEASAVRAVLSALTASLYGAPLAREVRELEEAAEDLPACPLVEEDAVQLRAQVLEQRYAQENRFLQRVAKGDAGVLTDMAFPIRFERAPARLRSGKNMAIVLNTLMRKALEQAQVHPYYLDAISTRWALRIEGATRPAQLEQACRDMVRDYCHQARKHSMAGYSPNVRAMLNCVQFSLADPELSLHAIAARLGVNASYLSQQFNREVGKSLPEYVAGCRVAEAKKLLRATPPPPVGQVAAAVGFQDVNYFAKVFKKHTGQTPTAFRAGG